MYSNYIDEAVLVCGSAGMEAWEVWLALVLVESLP